MSGLDLLVEVGAEEIPAGYMAPALAAIEERLSQALDDAGLEHGGIKTWCTPRRLALAVYQLAEQQPDAVREVTGPPAKAAFDASGNPTKAAVGFAKGQGVEVTDLVKVDTPKGEYLMARKEIKGRPAAEVLEELLPPLILGLPFPKSMRWGRGEVVFVRPIHWLLAVLGGRVLNMKLGDIQADRFSYGHRFHHPGPVEVTSPDQYEDRLAEASVIVSHDRRVALVRQELNQVLAEGEAGLTIIPDEELVTEVADLVEQPAAVLGRFDDVFLEMPSEVATTAMREHQRYFALSDAEGRLRPYFIAVNNTRARDLSVVKRGHERVLRARLDDARFYFEEDRKKPLESMQEELKRVVYHTRLGTSWQKVERFSALAGYLADRLEPGVKADLLRAASLCKCDLVSGVVSEFPSLQGLMGRDYARRDGETEAVALAIFEHYLPNRAGGALPSTPAGALLSLADKLDTICGCFGVGLIPTGAADPYALRRQALGVINIILDRGYRVSLAELIDQALEGLDQWLKKPAAEVRDEVLEFFRLRLKNQLQGQGVSADGAEAVLALHFDDLVSAVAKVRALEDIKSRPDFEDLAAAFKRVVNIIKKFGAQESYQAERLKEDQEKDLAAQVEAVWADAAELAAADDYARLLESIVGLKPAVDLFFDHVLVDDPDPEVKTNRLGLLTRAARLFELVADFTRISA